jgi:hypothetical protein
LPICCNFMNRWSAMKVPTSPFRCVTQRCMSLASSAYHQCCLCLTGLSADGIDKCRVCEPTNEIHVESSMTSVLEDSKSGQCNCAGLSGSPQRNVVVHNVPRLPPYW